MVYSDEGERIYTLQGADYAYRVMVESIHEGAANIKADGTILYCNKRLAEMLKMPLEKVLGSSFYKYLLSEDQEAFNKASQVGLDSFGRVEVTLVCDQDTTIPVLITASAADVDGRRGVSLVVTDLTEQKQALARERELQSHLMDQREEERIRIARNLHDGPLQDIIGLSYTVQAMTLPTQTPVSGGDLKAIRESILKLAGDLRHVCNELRPPNTIRFGLSKAIQYQIEETLLKYPELTIKMDLAEDGQKLSKEVITSLFRIYQECMNNVLRHSNARVVKVRVVLENNTVQMEVQDDGKGFTPPQEWVELARQGHLGMVGMKERAEAVGGKIYVTSEPSSGTTIRVEVPCGPCE